MSSKDTGVAIRTALGHRLLHDVMIKTAQKYGTNGAMVLVLDDFTAKIVSSCLRATDLIDNGILAIESLHRVREPLLTYSAIYFLSTTPQSIDLLIQDFTKTKDKPRYQMYKSAHVFLTTAITDPLMDKIENSDLVNFLGTLQEINIDFTTIENRVFSIASASKLPIYFWGQRELLEYRLKTDAFKLVSLFLTLNDYPSVRYDSRSKLATKFASLFYQDLVSIRKNSGWESNTRGCVVIVDRAIDLITPLMHEFTYQAIAYDLCGHNNGELMFPNNETYPTTPLTPEETEKRQIILNENEDEIWSERRFDHIAIVMKQLGSDLKSFRKGNKMAQWEEMKRKEGNDDAQLSAKDMAAALRDLAEYKKLASKFNKHMELMKECVSKIDARKLKEIGHLEAALATGYDDNGDKIDSKTVVKDLKSICLNRHVNIEEKIRLILLYLITQGQLSQAVIDQLLGNDSNVDPAVKAAIYAIDKIYPNGAIFGNDKHKAPELSKARRKEGDARSENINFLRWVPVVWELAQLFTIDKLPEHFQYCDPKNKFNQASAYAGAGKSKRTTKVADHVNTKPYMCVFVLGGITYSEMRDINRIAEEKKINLIIGGSEILTPRAFLSNLANCTQEAWVEYCSPALVAGARQQGKQAPLCTSRYDPKQYKLSLIELEKDEIAKVEGTTVTIEKVPEKDDGKDDKKKKKPTRFNNPDSDSDDDIPQL